jgi:hypothetical protein
MVRLPNDGSCTVAPLSSEVVITAPERTVAPDTTALPLSRIELPLVSNLPESRLPVVLLLASPPAKTESCANEITKSRAISFVVFLILDP